MLLFIPIIIDILAQLKPDGSRSPIGYPIDLKRFRVTLDCTTLNSWVLQKDINNNFALLPPEIATGSNSIKMYSPAIENTLRNIEEKFCHFYAKIDLSEAYHSILISEKLRPLFCTRSIDQVGIEHFWRYKTLSQGWNWSPYLFRMAISIVIAAINKTARNFTVRNVFDDVVMLHYCKHHTYENFPILVILLFAILLYISLVGCYCTHDTTPPPKKFLR